MGAVGCLAAALAGAGGGSDVFEDEGVGHFDAWGVSVESIGAVYVDVRYVE